MALPTAQRGARGGGLILIGNFITAIIQLAAVMTLSRLLSPEDFGLIAMATVFISLGNLVRDFGMPIAALQAKALSNQQASNLFWANTILASVAAALLTALSPAIAMVNSEPRLNYVIPGLAVAVVINGIASQIQIDLARKMRYNTLVISDITAQATGLFVATGTALAGLGYWALIAQALSVAAVSLTIRWLASRWKPMALRRGQNSAPLLRAGSQYGVAHLLTFIQNNADSFIIGILLGPIQLGYYNRAYQLLMAPAGRILDPLTQVVIPTINRLRDEGHAYEPHLLRIQFLVGSALGLLFAITGGTAAVLVPLALGPGWGPTVHVFEVLALGGSILALSHVSYWAFLLNEQSNQLLKYNLVSKPLAVACIASGSIFGIQGTAWGFVAAMALSWPLNLFWLSRTASFPSRQFALNGSIILVAGASASLFARFVTVVATPTSPLLALLLATLSATVVMLVALVTFPTTRDAFCQAITAMKSFIGGPTKE